MSFQVHTTTAFGNEWNNFMKFGEWIENECKNFSLSCMSVKKKSM